MSSRRHITTIKGDPYSSTNLIICLPIHTKQQFSKSLLPYKTKTLLEHQIAVLSAIYPNAEIYLVLGYEGEKILKKLYRNAPVHFITNDLHLSTNTTYGISLAIQASRRSSLLIVHPNILFDEKIRLETNRSQVISDGYIQQNSVGLFTHNDYVTGFSYSFDKKWSKIAMLCEKEFELFARLSFEESTHSLFDYEMFNRCIENGGRFQNISTKGMIREVEGYNDLT